MVSLAINNTELTASIIMTFLFLISTALLAIRIKEVKELKREIRLQKELNKIHD